VENGAVGPCYGFAEIWPDDTSRKEGYFVRSTAKGDRYFVHYWQNRGDQRIALANWEIDGGTGKWEGAIGRGTSTWFQLKSPPKGQGRGSYKGVLYLKKNVSGSLDYQPIKE